MEPHGSANMALMAGKLKPPCLEGHECGVKVYPDRLAQRIFYHSPFWVVIAGDSLFEGMLVGWLAGVLDFFIPRSGNISIRGPPSPRSFLLTLSVVQTLTTSGG